MSLRMWRKNGPILSVEGKKGFFDIAYGSDSDAQKLDVYLPEGKGKFAAIISIHGGGYIACDKRQKDMLEPMLKALDRGIAVIALNYRLSMEAKYPEPLKDIKQAIRYIKVHADEWNIDADKLVAWGGSAGGYYALMACLCDKDKEFDNENDLNIEADASIAGAIAWYPCTDFTTLDDELKINSVMSKFLRKEFLDNSEEYEPCLGMLEESSFPYHDAEDAVDALFLNAPCKSKTGELASPINRIHKNVPPILIQHGSEDEILPMQQSIRFTLKANEICEEERIHLEIIPHAIHSSVLFETEENINKCLDFAEKIVVK